MRSMVSQSVSGPLRVRLPRIAAALLLRRQGLRAEAAGVLSGLMTSNFSPDAVASDGPAPPNNPHACASPPVLRLETREGCITLATVHLDSRLSADEHAREFALAINGFVETRMKGPDPRSVLQGLYLGTVHVTFGELSPRITRRTKALCDRDRFDGIGVQWHRSGEWHGRVGDQSVVAKEGTVMLLDFSQPFSMTNASTRSFVMALLPRSLASRLAENPSTLHGRTLEAGDGAVMAGFLSGITANPQGLRADQGAALADTLIDLAALAFATDAEPEMPAGSDPRQWVRDRVSRLINMQLRARDLTPEWIARKLSLSRTELYAAFPGGGIASLIWERRLEAAHELLVDPHEQRSIAAIAQLFGFASDAHFSRAFKQRYGVAPGTTRKAARV